VCLARGGPRGYGISVDVGTVRQTSERLARAIMGQRERKTHLLPSRSKLRLSDSLQSYRAADGLLKT